MLQVCISGVGRRPIFYFCDLIFLVFFSGLFFLVHGSVQAVELVLSNSIALISDLIRPTVSALGVELWGIEHIVQGRFSVLRIYIDKGGDGITIEDCEKVSRQISGILDVEDAIAGEYTLEVSSPGMDRPLFELSQFERYVGSVATVRLRTPIEGRRKFKGVIQKVEADAVCLLVDDKEYILPASAIDKANLVF